MMGNIFYCFYPRIEEEIIEGNKIIRNDKIIMNAISDKFQIMNHKIDRIEDKIDNKFNLLFNHLDF